MSRAYRALDRSGEAGVDPVAGEKQSRHWRDDIRPLRLTGRQRERRAWFADNGGTLLQVDRVTKLIELPTRLTPPGTPTLGWGHVDELVYAHPPDLVDLRVNTIQRAGWTRFPTLIGQRYTGRAYTG